MFDPAKLEKLNDKAGRTLAALSRDIFKLCRNDPEQIEALMRDVIERIGENILAAEEMSQEEALSDTADVIAMTCGVVGVSVLATILDKASVNGSRGRNLPHGGAGFDAKNN